MPRDRGRPSRRIDPASPYAEFAHGLVGLRQAAGYTVAALAKKTSYSQSSISEAAGGRTLPSEDVTLAYARACGASPEEWLAKRALAGRQHDTLRLADDQAGRSPVIDLIPGQPTAASTGPRAAAVALEPDQGRDSERTPMTPTSIDTLVELAGGLNELRGYRSFTELSTRSARLSNESRGIGALARSTLSDLLRGKSVPSRETMTAFLTVCDLDPAEQQPWLAAWERVRTGHLRRPVGAIRVVMASPRLLGVHASIQVDSAAGARDELPVYVPRDIDGSLRDSLHAASRRGGLTLLVGGSSTGKTRTLFEAVRAVLPEWWLLAPTDTGSLMDIAERPVPRTVVWLDDLPRYLREPGSAVAAVRRLIVAGVVVAGTLSPGHTAQISESRLPSEQEFKVAFQQIIDLAHVVTVPDVFSAAERHRAANLVRDRRIQVALETTDPGVTQVLAAGPELIRHWEDGFVYGKAIITAAMDARRMGAQAPLTAAFLAAAAPTYLSSAQQATASADWLKSAISYATIRLRGAASCLIPVAAGMGQTAGYLIADYLYQHASHARQAIVVPDQVWQALIDHHHPADTARLAEYADRHGQDHHALTLYRQLALTGHGTASWRLAALLADQGREDELRQRAETGDQYATRQLASLLAEDGRVDEGIALLWARADASDDRPAARDLARLLAKHGRLDELQQLAEEGGQPAAWRLATARAEQNKPAQPRRHDEMDDLRQRADTGSSQAAYQLAKALAEQGLVKELRQRADAGELQSARQLAFLLTGQGRLDELRQRADTGDQEAARQLAFVLAGQGQLDELRSRADTGDPNAANRLAKALIERGLLDELRQRADAGDRHAMRALRAIS